ncbi:hypothetical protein E0Z10_g2259 [Xylaria hypoxylon]|uniref:Clr5 domain-containing protein n=1 Tax=Xylaria hypoxylon TaxID=37992 RepID=A0A4Z0Z2U1_9PEZI|nr:hypothetical protein E0Z10_g2259 [Xylaria hypoxylon]
MPSPMTQVVNTDPLMHTCIGEEETVEAPKNNRMNMKIWDEHRPTLEKLYVVENNPLDTVMKVMKDNVGFIATTKQWYLGERWGWKKYKQGGQDKPKKSSGRRRKHRSRNGSSKSNEEGFAVSSNESEVSSRDIASLRMSLSQLFSNQGSDEESLGILKGGNPRDISRCLRCCFRWFDKEINTFEAQFALPYGEASEAKTYSLDGKYDIDAPVFIYFLDRYIASLGSPPNQYDWDVMAKGIRFCPIKMLFTMSTLIVVVVSNAVTNAKRLHQKDILFPHILNAAKFGIDQIRQNGWRDEKLMAEFCEEFETILGDHAKYGNAINAAVLTYGKQKWSEAQANEELGFGVGAGYQDEWAGILPEDMQDGGGMFSVDGYHLIGMG